MNTIKKILYYFLPLGVIFLAVIVVIGMAMASKGKRPDRQDNGKTAVLVEAIPAEARSLNFIVRSQGTVRPRTQTTLVAQVSGIVVSVSDDYVPGGFFRAGEVLIEIDPSDYRTALKRAEATLASRKARLSEEKSRSEQSVKDWRNLGRAGDPPDLVMRKPQLADALANVQAAEAEVEKARRDLQRTKISVPYDGLLRERRVDLGQYVTPGSQLGVVFAVDTAEVRLPLAATDLAYLDLPPSIDTHIEDYPQVSLSAEIGGEIKTWDARLIRTEGVLDESSRVLYAVASIVDPYGLLGQSSQEELRMGTFVSAAIDGRYVNNVVVLPRYVLRNDNTVLVANSERELEVRDVTVARAEARLVFITEGVSDGELVVTTTLDAPIPGTRLAIRGEEPPGNESGAGAQVAASEGS